ncbi:MAG: hypothetical protein QFX34_01595 [Candidatus Verstraetearchaeota archaeon]|nr:hypothetical protein [Candidatus Verstraetearchaeota archaeon]
MGEILKVEVDKALARRFKKRAMQSHGYKKGAVKKALVDLVERFALPARADWGALRGSLKCMGETSVSLQHRALRDAD